MITYPLNENCEPIIPIELHKWKVAETENVERIKGSALIDTGFEGFLYAPFELAASCKMSLCGKRELIPFSGKSEITLVCHGKIYVLGKGIEGQVDIGGQHFVNDKYNCVLGQKFLKAINCEMSISYGQKMIIFNFV